LNLPHLEPTGTLGEIGARMQLQQTRPSRRADRGAVRQAVGERAVASPSGEPIRRFPAKSRLSARCLSEAVIQRHRVNRDTATPV
jgi:hypothetical protein